MSPSFPLLLQMKKVFVTLREFAASMFDMVTSSPGNTLQASLREEIVFQQSASYMSELGLGSIGMPQTTKAIEEFAHQIPSVVCFSFLVRFSLITMIIFLQYLHMNIGLSSFHNGSLTTTQSPIPQTCLHWLWLILPNYFNVTCIYVTLRWYVLLCVEEDNLWYFPD